MQNPNAEALAVRDDNERINAFIEKHKGFIISCAYKTIHRYVSENDEEYAVALIAFHEAIQRYNEERGEFLPFAALVIRRRLTDKLRSERPEIPVEPERFEGSFDEEDDTTFESSVSGKIIDLALYQHRAENDAEALKEEIAEAQELLGSYGFSFFDLVDCSPKSAKTKDVCKQAVLCLLKPGALLERMRSTKTLPIKEITEITGVPRKKLERHRKYIMAAAELLAGDFPQLNEYLLDIKRELL